MSGRQGKSFRHLFFLVLGSLAGIALLVILAAALQLRHMLGTIHYVSPEDAPSLSQEELDALTVSSSTELSCRQTDVPPLHQEESTQPEVRSDKRINLLLIGQDTRTPGSQARSDAMILCSFHKDSKQLTMISFLRDLYVQIPGYRSNRLNAAYAAGGMPLLKQTFSENFGLRIDGCFEVDFDRFVQLVDLLGGVRIDLRQDEADSISRSVPGEPLAEGTHYLTGQQALAYARIRNLDADSDFSRTQRQRKLLTAIAERCRESRIEDLLELLGRALPLVSTDLSRHQLAVYSAELLPLFPEMETETLRIPADGTYEAKTIDGMAVLVADPTETKKVLDTALFNE